MANLATTHLIIMEPSRGDPAISQQQTQTQQQKAQQVTTQHELQSSNQPLQDQDALSRSSFPVINRAAKNLDWIIRKRNLFAHICIWTIVTIVLILALTVFSKTIIGVIYLVFFFSFVLLFQASYAKWASIIKVYSYLLGLYSFTVACVSYSYQFEEFRNLYASFMSESFIEDLGLQNNDQLLMFGETALPTILILLIAGYLRFFEDDFKRLVYLASENDVSLSLPLTTNTAQGSNLSRFQGSIRNNNTFDNSATIINLTTSNVIGESRDFSPLVAEQTFVETALQQQVSQPRNTSAIGLSANKRESIKSIQQSFSDKLSQNLDIIWRLLEVHYIKFVAFSIFCFAIHDLCLVNFPLILLTIIILRSSACSGFACLMSSFLISTTVIARVSFTLPSLKTTNLNVTCTSGPLANTTSNIIEYVGLSHDSNSSHVETTYQIIILLIITIRTFVKIHYDGRSSKSYELAFGVIFKGIGRRQADSSFIESIKYFINFGFYEFGVEVTLMSLAIAISHRLDVFGFIYGVCLVALSMIISRRTLSVIWPMFNFVVMLLIPLQYIMMLGLPKALCVPYFWSDLPKDVKYWFYLPDYSVEQYHDFRFLLFDFIVLLATCSQAKVFKQAKNFQSTSNINLQLHHELTAEKFRHEYLPTNSEFKVDDCFSTMKNQNSFMKSTFFVSIYWITLATVLIAGATNVSLFSLGYLIGCFIFLWLGNDSYLEQPHILILKWSCLILYATLVILSKVGAQFLACYYLSMDEPPEHVCTILRLLRVVCKNPKGSYTSCRNNEELESPVYDEYDVLWDGVCLFFLLMQRVVFGTQYFRYLVDEVKAQQILASRGAELIRETQIEEAKAQDLYDKQVAREIRQKMENLKLDNVKTAEAWKNLLKFPYHHQIIRNTNKHLFSSLDYDTPVSNIKQDNSWFKQNFIPDPLGEELERMSEINGVTAVFIRWMKGQPLYGPQSSYSSQQSESSCVFDDAQAGTSYDPQQDDIHSPSTSFDRQQQQHSIHNQPTSSFVPDGDSSRFIDPSRPNVDVIGEQFAACSEDNMNSDECGSRVKTIFEYINLLLYSCLLSATVQLNRFSRSYRYVSRRLQIEKSLLKQQYPDKLGDILSDKDPNRRKLIINEISKKYSESSSTYPSSSTSLHRIRSTLRIISSYQHSQDYTRASPIISSVSSCNTYRPEHQATTTKMYSSGSQQQQFHQQNQSLLKPEECDPEYSFLKLNMFTQFIRAFGYVFISNTALLCHLVIIFNQLFTASILSLPLPLLTFLWGTLSVPRPTKRFWKTVITYTDIVIVIKYIFQFPIDSFEKTKISPFYYTNLLGIKNATIFYDLCLLLVLFLHRSMLKTLGQWDATGDEDAFRELTQDNYDIIRAKSSSPPSPCATKPISRSESVGKNLSESTANRVPSMPNVSKTMQTLQYSKSIETDTPLSSKTNNLTSLSAAPQSLNNVNLQVNSNNSSINSDSPLYLQQQGDNLEVHNDYKSATGCCRCILCETIVHRIVRSIRTFFLHVLETPYKVQTDVYTCMFFMDFINFLILIYGFWAFGGGYTNQTVASFLNENRIPFSVLFMLLLQFGSIIVDRVLYLQKNLPGKLLFQVVLVIGIHGWIFFWLPATTGRAFNLDDSWPPKAWYIIKSFYFLFSAHQIRSGYPRRVLGNCLTKGFGYANWGAFKVYRAIPLVYDLRLYMDWIWTETTLEFRNWSIMEDVFATVFIRKCELTIEEEFPYERAKPISRLSKYMTGGSFILLILAIVWSPLLLFSMGKTVGQANPPLEVEYELEFVGYQPILRMRATTQSINILDSKEYDKLKQNFTNIESQTFFGDYKVGDVALVRVDGQSNAVWEISPPSFTMLKRRLEDAQDVLTLRSSWIVYRVKRQKSQNIDINIAGSYSLTLDNSTVSMEFRKNFSQMLEQPADSERNQEAIRSVKTPRIFPNYIRVPETGQASLVELDRFNGTSLKSLTLFYLKKVPTKNSFEPNVNLTWWRASTENASSQQELKIYTFNDRIFTGFLALLSAPGIIGLYTTFVVFFARLIRTEPSGKVIYTEIANVDRVYALLLDIYMMRESKEFELEEKLFAKLLLLYRSPELMLEWSRRDL